MNDGARLFGGASRVARLYPPGVPGGIVEFATSDAYLGKKNTSVPQKAILKALYGETLTSEERDAFRAMADGRDPIKGGYRKMAAICGRRGGKTDRLGAVFATYECVRWGPILQDDQRTEHRFLQPGEIATGIIIAQNKVQAAICRGYIEGNLRTLEDKGFDLLAAPGGQRRSVTEQVIKLRYPIQIKILPANKASARGLTGLFAVLDEVAWWRVEDGAYNQDKEIVRSLRACFSTLAAFRPKMLLTSSPHEESGVLYDEYIKRKGSRTLVVKATSQMLNPSLDQADLDEAAEEDPEAFDREYMANFQPVGGGSRVFLPGETIDRCIDSGVEARPPSPGNDCLGAIDAAFKQDRFAFAIGHLEEAAEAKSITDPVVISETQPGTKAKSVEAYGTVVIDYIQVWTPRPGVKILDPDEIVPEIATVCREYLVDELWGDQFSDVPLRSDFRDQGLELLVEDQTPASSWLMWKNLRGVLRAGLARLLDHRQARLELKGLVTSTTQKLKMKHVGAPDRVGAYDDIAKVIALLCLKLLPLGVGLDISKLNRHAREGSPVKDWRDEPDRFSPEEQYGTDLLELDTGDIMGSVF